MRRSIRAGAWSTRPTRHRTEVRALAASGAVAGLCPLTEASLGDGIFDAAGYLAAGGTFGIGTDSNIQIDAAAELRQLEYGQRLARRARNVMTVGARIDRAPAVQFRSLPLAHRPCNGRLTASPKDSVRIS